MNVRVALVAGVLVGGIAGFVLGRLGNDPRGRASSNRNTSARDDAAVRTTRGPRATDGSALNGDAELRKEVETLRRRLARFEPEAGTDPDATNEEDLPPGTRRKNGTIVGGAEWTPMVRETALGFLDTMLKEFLKEANLHPDQEQRLRAEMDTRISEAMQISASFLNGDVTGDEAYERMGIMARDGRTMLGTVLDERQMEIYRK
ncbi:MAG: hypothetical protein OER88_05155, partial [Planctomycetota bacterium]|nr:hypothetical protein [Planctomycetota bacterium]